MKTKIITLVATLLLALSVTASSSFADNERNTTATNGENLTWKDYWAGGGTDDQASMYDWLCNAVGKSWYCDQ